MVDRRPLLLLPMQLTGTPIRVAQWLRAAGVPSVDFSSGAVADGRTNAPHSRGPLLFDSRTPASRADAERAVACGWETIDVARLLAQREPEVDDGSHFVLFDESPPAPFPRFQRRDFLDRLKQKVESGGGIWARIADFPFPCRNAVIEFRSPDELNIKTTGDDADWGAMPAINVGASPADVPTLFREHYAAGRPVLTLCDDALSGSPHADAVLQGDEFPLIWRTSPAEFVSWRRQREGMQFRLQKQDSVCRIDCSFDPAGFRPALEIWRGNHVASIPMSNGPMEIELTGLVFQQSSGRHPAGFTAIAHPLFSTETNLAAKAVG